MNPASTHAHLPSPGLDSARYSAKVPLLASGILASLLYGAMNVVAAMRYPGYDSASQTVSELSAIGAPSREVWVVMAAGYTVLVIAFGIGIWLSGASRALKVVAASIILQGAIGPFWPPMHSRAVLAAGGGTSSDVWHIVVTAIWLALVIASLAAGAVAFGKRFQIYTLVSMAILIVFGILTGVQSPQLQQNLPTPLMGVWERINIGVYLAWMIVLAVILLRSPAKRGTVED